MVLISSIILSSMVVAVQLASISIINVLLDLSFHVQIGVSNHVTFNVTT